MWSLACASYGKVADYKNRDRECVLFEYMPVEELVAHSCHHAVNPRQWFKNQ